MQIVILYYYCSDLKAKTTAIVSYPAVQHSCTYWPATEAIQGLHPLSFTVPSLPKGSNSGSKYCLVFSPIYLILVFVYKYFITIQISITESEDSADLEDIVVKWEVLCMNSHTIFSHYVIQVVAERLKIQHLPESGTGGCCLSTRDKFPAVPSEENLSCGW
jgi:hypothetical protein